LSRPPTPIVAGFAAIVVLVSAATALGALSKASRLEVADPKESRSRLDVREVDAGSTARDLVFTVLTWRRWRTSQIRDRGYLLIHLDPRTGSRYYVLVRSGGRAMSGVLFRKQAGRDTRAGRLKVWRSDRKSVSVRIPRGRLAFPAPGGQYSWRVQSLTTGERCKRVCFDLAPDAVDAVDTVPPAAASP
jgi:hypothetical protein